VSRNFAYGVVGLPRPRAFCVPAMQEDSGQLV